MAGLHFVNTVDNTQALQAAKQLQNSFKDIQTQAQSTGTSIDEMAKKVASLTGVTIGVAGLKNLTQQVMNVRGEFQQLEIAFSTMLGSAEEANKLMQQLTTTAAKTPFDLKGIAQGAKQLLAYGIQAKDVNQTLINLGDIAAGVSVPLNDLVYLYGTTMVQGRMFTQDLRQFQGRGIPIAEALAEQFGVATSAVQDLVSAGKVGAEEFNAAIMSMVGEGGKFGGLMDKQSKSITGQISNIQDGIDMMFNEIGQNSEGVINLALSGVSKLVENYKSVGKALLALAGTYGTYKAALVAVSAVQRAHNSLMQQAILEQKLAAAANIQLSNSAAIETAKKTIFTKAIKANTQALLRNTAAMLTNPAVLITAGLVALVGAIIATTKALNTEANAQERVNKAQERTQKIVDEAKSATDEAIGVLQSETATVYEKAKAYQTLQKYMPEFTKQYTQAEIATMNLAQAQTEQAKAMEELEFDEKRKEIENTKNTIAGLENQLKTSNSQSGGYYMKLASDIEAANKALSAQEKELAEMEKLRKQAEFDAQPAEVKIAKFTADKEQAEKQLQDLQKQAEEAAAKAKEEWENNPLNQWKIGVGITFEQEAGNDPSKLGGEYILLQTLIKGVQNNIDDTEKKIEGLQDTTQTKNLPQLIASIREAEKQVEAARAKYSADMTDDNKKNITKAEETLNTATEKYKAATDKAWYDTKRMYEEMTIAQEKYANERQKILNSSIKSERAQREAAYWQQIKEINQEEAAYKKAHNGRTSGEFDTARSNAKLQFDLDTEELDRQFADWKKQFEQSTNDMQIETELSGLQEAINMAQTYADKVELQNKLYAKQNALIAQRTEQERDELVRKTYGENAASDFQAFYGVDSNKEVLSTYRNAKTRQERETVSITSGISESLLAMYAEIQQIYEQYEQRLAATTEQAMQEQNADLLRQDIDDYIEYCNEIVAAAEWRNQQLAAIASGEEQNRTSDMVEKDYTAKVQEANLKHGIDSLEKNAAGIVENLVKSLADVTYKEIDDIASEFYQELDKQVEQISKAKGFSEDDRAQQTVQTEDSIALLQTQQADPTLTDEERLAVQERLIAAEQQLAYLKMTDAQLDAEMNKLESTRQIISNKVTSAKETSGKRTIAEQQKEERAIKATMDALGGVADAAKAVADTMGGALSQKAKKAVKAISDIAEFGMQAVQSIQSVVSGVAKSMQLTTEGAVASMSSLEKASLILTIISVAVQLIMKIVEIASQFTESAKIQNAIDSQLERVDELKRRNEELQREYKSKVGVDYYKGMAKSAQQYNDVIKAQEKALKEANELYKLQSSKYAEDSDKVKDADEQRKEIEDDLNSLKDEQANLMQELRDELLTTDLKSFSESLADSLVEGFENGKEGIAGTWDDMLNDLLKSMLKKQLAIQLEKQFENVFNRMNGMVDTDGNLSQDEIDTIVELMNGASAGAQKIAETYYDIMDEMGLLTDSDNEGSKGGFESMSQDTADELNARFTALQIEGANVVVAAQGIQTSLVELTEGERLRQSIMQAISDNCLLATQIAQSQLEQLRSIAGNTAALQETNRKLKLIEQYTSKL